MVGFLSRVTAAKLKIEIIVFFLWINLHLKNSNIIESERPYVSGQTERHEL